MSDDISEAIKVFEAMNDAWGQKVDDAATQVERTFAKGGTIGRYTKDDSESE